MPSPRSVALSTAVAATMVGTLLAAPMAVASPRSTTEARKSQVDAQVAEAAEDLAGTSAELTGAYQRLADARGQLPAAQAALDTAKAVEAEAARKDAEAAGRLAAAEQAQTQARADVADSASQMADTRLEMGRLAAASYRRGMTSNEWSVVMKAQSPDDFADRYVLADTVMRSQAGTMSNLSQRQAVQVNAETRLAAVSEQVSILREEARAALAAAEAARADAAAKKTAVDNLIAAEAAATAVIESRKAEEEAQLNALKAEQDKLTAQLRRIADEERAAAARQAAASRGASGGTSSGSSGSAGSSGGGMFSNPIGTYKTSNYGYRIHPIYKTRRLHTGTDFGGGCGVPITAAADGRVISAGWAGGYGNRIVVAHGVMGGNSMATTYNHLSRYAVRSGNVSRGQVIGYSGTTGASTGCHLHFEVLRNGNYVDPMGYL